MIQPFVILLFNTQFRQYTAYAIYDKRVLLYTPHSHLLTYSCIVAFLFKSWFQRCVGWLCSFEMSVSHVRCTLTEAPPNKFTNKKLRYDQNVVTVLIGSVIGIKSKNMGRSSEYVGTLQKTILSIGYSLPWYQLVSQVPNSTRNIYLSWHGKWLVRDNPH